LLTGEVNDENAWALGGAAGHAGLFGTAEAVGVFARAVLRTLAGDRLLALQATLRGFAARTGVPGSSRALGWDTMLPTSSCGTRLSATSIGHTGFTGTSLWIDWERDLYIVLLTNRVHPTRDNERLRAIRPRLHDAVVAAFDG
jgi:CubicO group peptidase (beta-lactamase class C family)